MSTLSTHVLDSVLGTPARGVPVEVARVDADDVLLATATTDDDGRVRFDLDLRTGTYLLRFATATYFGGREHLYPEVTLAFVVDPTQRHYHLALLLGPHSYTTYRGS